MFSMDGEGASGLDGFSGTFFTTAWEVIGHHVVVAVQEFFIRAYLPVGFSSTLIALIPKVLNPATFTDFRPISLCNFIAKIIPSCWLRDYHVFWGKLFPHSRVHSSRVG